MEKTHLIFLHGALGSQLQWQPISSQFEKEYVVHAPNFPGHGQSNTALKESSYLALGEWLDNYIQANAITNYGLIGYSMGGYIGLQHILKNTKINCEFVITIATKLAWNQEIAEKEVEQLTLEKLEPIANKLREEHLVTIETLLKNTQEILLSIGKKPLLNSEFVNNKIPVFMLLGGKDKMVTAQEILSFQENQPNMYFEHLENQPHLLERMDPLLLTEKIALILKTLIN